MACASGKGGCIERQEQVRAGSSLTPGGRGQAPGQHFHGAARLHHRPGLCQDQLADIARTAGMSPSHLLYYFPGKDAMLGQYFAHVTNRIVSRLNSFRTETPDRQIQLLATLFFAGQGITKAEIGFMLECFGVAVHDPNCAGRRPNWIATARPTCATCSNFRRAGRPKPPNRRKSRTQCSWACARRPISTSGWDHSRRSRFFVARCSASPTRRGRSCGGPATGQRSTRKISRATAT